MEATDDAELIGQRARLIRRRRGLLEDLAAALGCAVADLIGQPYPRPDRATADALACLPAISLALYE